MGINDTKKSSKPHRPVAPALQNFNVSQSQTTSECQQEKLCTEGIHIYGMNPKALDYEDLWLHVACYSLATPKTPLTQRSYNAGDPLCRTIRITRAKTGIIAGIIAYSNDNECCLSCHTQQHS